MPPQFSFRLNGTIVPMLFINRERVKGKLTGRAPFQRGQGTGRKTVQVMLSNYLRPGGFFDKRPLESKLTS